MGWELGAGLAGLGLLDELGPGWVGWADRRRVAGWAGPEPSLRHVRQAWPAGGHAFHLDCQHKGGGAARQNFGLGFGEEI